jgi:hypothetical protein
MYYPYLRGKQFELIALRELSEIMAEIPHKISPIIEPVRNSSTLKSTIKELRIKDINFNIILNPLVGDLIGSTNDIIETISSEMGFYTNFQLGIIIDSKMSVSGILKIIQNISFAFSGFSLIHVGINNNIELIIRKLEEKAPVTNNIIYFNKTSRRYYRDFPPDTRIGLDDYFSCLTKNSDYLFVPDSQFSEEHIFYREDGYKGFADFLTIGDNYSESGFLPYAVAIHLSYIEEDNKIRIKHFVSDSNDDTSDIGGKFAEANEKLIEWCDNNDIYETIAISQFRSLHDSGHFPGLGSIKKLSIMHHIELVKNLI